MVFVSVFPRGFGVLAQMMTSYDDVIMRAHAPLSRALVKSLSSFSEFT
jgi:hypothetical protein